MMCKEKQVLIEDFIITINNLTFFLNQNPSHLVEIVVLLILGYQQGFITMVKTLTCFL